MTLTKLKAIVMHAAKEQPTMMLKSYRKYETKGRRFEDENLWKFLGVSNEERKKISVGYGV